MLLELQIVKDILGGDPKDYTVVQVGIRALITYIFTIVIIKLGHKRFMGQSTALDAVLGLILGSVMSRAINGQAAFFPTLLGGVILILIHYAGCKIAFRSDAATKVLKGQAHILIDQGRFLGKQLRRHDTSEADVLQAVRLSANLDSLDQVQSAYLETSGQISVVKKEPKAKQPKVLEVKVEQGVQTIRIEWS